MSIINFYNVDCQDFMRTKPDKFYKLAIIDPPYFTGPEKRKYYGKKISSSGIKRIDYPVTTKWSIPDGKYFSELLRVSEHQIIWGCNYFNWQFGPGRIVWDKVNYDSSFSDCEIAYSSKHDSVRLFRFMWNGMLQGKNITDGHIMQGNKKINEKRIHPTQKPVHLYRWLLKKYANPGDNILDTHGGSGSIAIACDEQGYDLDICEIEKEHFDNSVLRFKNYKQQLTIF